MFDEQHADGTNARIKIQHCAATPQEARLAGSMVIPPHFSPNRSIATTTTHPSTVRLSSG
jgi:hypothetical protein